MLSSIGADAEHEGDDVSRADVARVLHALLEHGPIDNTILLMAGSTPIDDAVAALG